MESQRKPGTPARCDPVATDCSIYIQPDGTYTVVLREDGETMEFNRPTLKDAQRLWQLFEG